MAYKSAEELITAGYNGQWYKPGSEFEKEVIINSIAGDNLVRGNQSKPALRHYEQDGYIAVSDGAEVTTHPDFK